MNRQREITDILNKWAHEYYVLDAPTVSDKEYDTLYDELRALEQQSGVVYPDSPTRRVGGEIGENRAVKAGTYQQIVVLFHSCSNTFSNSA